MLRLQSGVGLSQLRQGHTWPTLYQLHLQARGVAVRKDAHSPLQNSQGVGAEPTSSAVQGSICCTGNPLQSQTRQQCGVSLGRAQSCSCCCGFADAACSNVACSTMHLLGAAEAPTCPQRPHRTQHRPSGHQPGATQLAPAQLLQLRPRPPLEGASPPAQAPQLCPACNRVNMHDHKRRYVSQQTCCSACPPAHWSSTSSSNSGLELTSPLGIARLAEVIAPNISLYCAVCSRGQLQTDRYNVDKVLDMMMACCRHKSAR